MAEARAVPVHESTPAIARMSGPAFARMSGPGPAVGSVRELELDGEGGTFRVRVLAPEAPARAILVYYHGGGWVIGDIDLQYDTLGRELVTATDSTVVMVNYRKAPEHPFPTAIEDSYTALEWVDAHRAELAPEGVPLIVGGDSAGGNIAAVMTHRARDRKGPIIDYQVLVYPVTDCDFSRPSYNAPENQLLLSRPTMEWFWNHYAPAAEDRTHPDASPLRHDDLSGLPPAFVYLAEHDPLHDEGREYAERLAQAGTEVELLVAEGQMHAFFQMINVLPGCRTGLDLIADRINALTSADSSESASPISHACANGAPTPGAASSDSAQLTKGQPA
ncbi:hypothetical protein GCM10022261_13030 [Brevibacterium daeguense]|uniref:Alpha/beta hydrolase fold-3 domain-containing protein n=2 Tax=Brevibacterium daeguense TaxID=909936 RepID=A0ABP8EIJ9_9MICO